MAFANRPGALRPLKENTARSAASTQNGGEHIAFGSMPDMWCQWTWAPAQGLPQHEGLAEAPDMSNTCDVWPILAVPPCQPFYLPPLFAAPRSVAVSPSPALGTAAKRALSHFRPPSAPCLSTPLLKLPKALAESSQHLTEGVSCRLDSEPPPLQKRTYSESS